MSDETLYLRIGRRYHPAGVHPVEVYRPGAHLILVSPTMTLTRHGIEPDHAALLAAAEDAREPMLAALREGLELRPERVPVTRRQKAACEELRAAFRGEVPMRWPGIGHAVDAAVSVLVKKAAKV